jgi:histidyl-tRNA synthetase
MATKKPQTARGMRDYLPADMRRRQYVRDILIEQFERFGYEPLGTPAIERADTLFGKYGPDAERLIYRVGLGREQDLALRYDLTVPTARVASSYADLPRPFKRYQIAPVWRGERPQRGRYREFEQADIDIIGSDSLLADAEIITLVIGLVEALGLPASQTRINNRKLLSGIGRYAGVPEALLPGLYRAIDKLDKIGAEGVRQELQSVGLPGEMLNRERQAVERWLRGTADRARLGQDLADGLDEDADPRLRSVGIEAFLDALEDLPFATGNLDALEGMRSQAMDASIRALRKLTDASELVPDGVTERLLALLAREGEPAALLAGLAEELDDDEARQGIQELETVLAALDAAGVPAERYGIDCAMVRGLDYYNGTIFETVVEDPPIGSLTGGGRYDGLLALFGSDQPAVGTSFGIDRLIDVMEELGCFPAALDRSGTQVQLCMLEPRFESVAIELASRLREAGLRCDLVFQAAAVGDHIRGALKAEVPVVLLLGSEEVQAGEASIRDLGRREQVRVPFAEAASTIQTMLGG